MSIKDLHHFIRNSKKLKLACADVLDSYASQSPYRMSSCKQAMTEAVNAWVKDNRDELASWRDFDTDYIEMAHVIIVQTINATLFNYRERRGIDLRVRSNYNAYRWYLYKCCKWGLEHNLMTQEQYNEYEFGFDKSDNFKNEKINKVVWLKVKKNNIYAYAIKQRGTVYGLRYSYSKSKGVAKSVPKILEQTMYFKVYYNDKKAN